MRYFLKMPALLPSSVIAVSQLPRWPNVSLSRSSARADAEAKLAATARAAISALRLRPRGTAPSWSTRFDAIEAADPANERIGADGEHEYDNQHCIHARHVEQAVGLNDQAADTAIRELGLRQQGPDDRDTKTQPHAVDNRMAHGRQINLRCHLPRIGTEAAPDANQNRLDLPHPGRCRERDREEAGDRSHCNLGPRADAKPHDHDREEDDLGRGTKVVKVRFVGLGEQSATSENQSHDQAG